MTRETHDPNAQRRRPLSVGTGNTGNPCEYPGCTDKNASLSTIWERSDQDHDFGGTNREPRCREHWGLDAPRIPHPREPHRLELDEHPGHPEGLPTVPELRDVLKEARVELRSNPEKVIGACWGILRQEGQLLAWWGKGVRQTLGECRDLLRRAERVRSGDIQKRDHGSSKRKRKPNDLAVRIEALESALGEARGLLERGRFAEVTALCAQALTRDPMLLGRGPRFGGGTFGDQFREVRRRAQNGGSYARGRVEDSRRSRETASERRGESAAKAKGNRPVLVPAERDALQGRYDAAEAMVARHPEKAIVICDDVLEHLTDRRGAAGERHRFSELRAEAERSRLR